MEIYTLTRMSEVVNEIDQKLDAGKLNITVFETLWVGLRKEECWYWQSGVPHCYSGWHAGYPTRTGGLSDKKCY